jgi:ubiquinone/menaquinone biosynthesis C-methylase UbiE
MSDDVYTHGHHESVLRSHEWRTAENSAPHLLPHLRPGQRVLDLGCGPGTITVDLARRVSPGGSVLGIDPADDVVARARRNHADTGDAELDVTFAVGDAYALEHAPGTFDVVHAHQVLQHLTDPVRALREARRVLRPGGLLAVRDSDYAGFFWAPADPRLDRWSELYHQVTRRNGAEADAGRHLRRWVREAGFDDLEVTSSTWTFTEPDARTWWGSLWADRLTAPGSNFGEQALRYGLAGRAELEDLAAGFHAWATEPEAIFVIPHVEVLARP